MRRCGTRKTRDRPRSIGAGPYARPKFGVIALAKKKKLKKALAATSRELERTRRELEYTDQAKQRAQERAAAEHRHSGIAAALVAALDAELDRLDPKRENVDTAALDWDALAGVLEKAKVSRAAEA